EPLGIEDGEHRRPHVVDRDPRAEIGDPLPGEDEAVEVLEDVAGPQLDDQIAGEPRLSQLLELAGEDRLQVEVEGGESRPDVSAHETIDHVLIEFERQQLEQWLVELEIDARQQLVLDRRHADEPFGKRSHRRLSGTKDRERLEPRELIDEALPGESVELLKSGLVIAWIERPDRAARAVRGTAEIVLQQLEQLSPLPR